MIDLRADLSASPFDPQAVPPSEADRPSLPSVTRAESCTLCGFCAQACPPHALRWVENPRETMLILAAADCDGCGKCVQVCEFKAIVLVPAPTESRENVILCSSPVVPCQNCGAPIASQAELAYIARQVGEAKWQQYCLDCRGASL